MSINKFRSWLYRLARGAGDVQAIERSIEKGSLVPIEKRIARRVAGRIAGRLLRSLIG